MIKITPNIKIKYPNRFARVSLQDERIARYPIDEEKFINIMYESTSDAEKAVREYNFGQPVNLEFPDDMVCKLDINA